MLYSNTSTATNKPVKRVISLVAKGPFDKNLDACTLLFQRRLRTKGQRPAESTHHMPGALQQRRELG
ncbi:hypothetical protein VZT92_004018 [Zoarces viviparus]|uniref:Uncharacterized protein n=1 Tax=Zoarces viviparus TaxID=48416 RepID=A0AAW1FVG1_ZOAVI